MLSVYKAGLDGRYYFKEAFKHLYVAIFVCAAKSKSGITGVVYFNINQESPIYDSADLYQDGFSFFLGAVVGYQFKLNENWNMDLYLEAERHKAIIKDSTKLWE